MTSRTGSDLCRAAETRLTAAGVVDARQDTSRLFLHAVEITSGQPVKRHHMPELLQAPVAPELETAFERLIKAREARQPVSQIIGKRAFWEHDFIVTQDTLDPRPETETVVTEALKMPWSSVLDLGTGTGAILISLLAARQGSEGIGTDISGAALDVARRNAYLIGVEAGFTVSDWYTAVDGRFDLIVSNPPYIALDEMAGLAPEVVNWEPSQALTDGADGLTAYRAIALGAPQHLTSGGTVLVEIGPTQGVAVSAIFRNLGAETSRYKDLDGRDRVISARF